MRLNFSYADLWRRWSARLIAAGMFLPELLQLIADNSHTLPYVSEDMKLLIRLICMVGALIVLPIRQKKLHTPEGPTDAK